MKMEKIVQNKGVIAVIILYNPDVYNLKKSLIALESQVENVVLIDNSPQKVNVQEVQSDSSNSFIYYYFLGGNFGVAKAQNIGIRYAAEKKADFVLIMDQDSIAIDNMVYELKKDLKFLRSKGCNIAAIGPIPINAQTQKPYSPRVKKHRPFFIENQNIKKVDELISSGCLIDLAVFEQVGLMDEKLFIDGVDHEWCWRAKSKGYECALSYNAKLKHMLGEGDKFFFGIRIAITSPTRVFFQYRNYFYLCRRQYVPFYWKLNNGFKYLIKIFYYPFFIKPKKLYAINIFKGIKAGLGIK